MRSESTVVNLHGFTATAQTSSVSGKSHVIIKVIAHQSALNQAGEISDLVQLLLLLILFYQVTIFAEIQSSLSWSPFTMFTFSIN